ncbi:30S ribosomal protein S1 [Thiocapsa imhoffii]|uniref:30S ribosomal protein S1 n=1 Tax=Thiocapsa imhoffii TaxID=382777 RepID=A0A9X0WHS6_9GAMM|nr:S1 RNA-binding domain-containing protein [Thiocapsa imhoffii]MBK1644971.1 30S ribosomal protein S1 [Thiocapsa imhoffii]
MSETERFEDLLKQFDQAHPTSGTGEPAIGAKVKGVLVALSDEFGFIDLGGKSEGRIDRSALHNADGVLTVGLGDTVETQVTGKDADTGMLLLGSQHGQRYHGIEEAERAYRQGAPVQGQVSAAVKGGLEVQIAGLRAFCPASQIDLKFIDDLTELVGLRFDFRITKLEGGRRPNLVVSRRVLLEEEQRLRAEATRAQLTEGAVLPGVVSSLQDYGAFVDIGGLEGMVHISELAFGHVKHPSEILTVGQPVTVCVLRIDPPSGPTGREKIALSIRALARNPWQDAVDRYPIGERVRGRVSRLQPFGAFVELESGIEGLVHISELGAERRVHHPSEVLNAGDEIAVTILGVDLERRRISLSLEPASPSPESLARASPTSGQPSETMPSPALGSFGMLLKETISKKQSK